jgi:hypothetical protein
LAATLSRSTEMLPAPNTASCPRATGLPRVVEAGIAYPSLSLIKDTEDC